ncbi:flagellar filament capping protein FliD [Enterobacteriaceae bacterium]
MPGILDVQTYAQQLAYADIATRGIQLKNQQADLDAENKALSTLESSLNDFKTAVDALNSETSGPIVNAVSCNNDSVTATADSSAMPGSYSFYVEQLAQAQQTSIAFSDTQIPASGTLTLTMGDAQMDIDLTQSDSDGDGSISASEMADAINHSDDNPGVTATLVKTGDTTTLMMTSDETGQASAFSLSSTGNASLDSCLSAKKDVSTAQDAVIYLGNDATGTKIVNSSNTFDDLIPGASITFTEVPDDGKPVTLKISQDEGTSEQKVQSFVDAYNSLVDTLDDLTDIGSDGSSGGAFAGDAGLRSLANQLGNTVHGDYNGASLIDYGITLDTNGHLQIDSEKFDAGMKKNPEGLTDIFVGDDSMVAQIDNLMDTYLDSSSGIITKRQRAITEQQDQISDQTKQLQETYNTNYERYVDEWTATLVEITQMQNSMAAFA